MQKPYEIDGFQLSVYWTIPTVGLLTSRLQADAAFSIFQGKYLSSKSCLQIEGMTAPHQENPHLPGGLRISLFLKSDFVSEEFLALP